MFEIKDLSEIEDKIEKYLSSSRMTEVYHCYKEFISSELLFFINIDEILSSYLKRKPFKISLFFKIKYKLKKYVRNFFRETNF